MKQKLLLLLAGLIASLLAPAPAQAATIPLYPVVYVAGWSGDVNVTHTQSQLLAGMAGIRQNLSAQSPWQHFVFTQNELGEKYDNSGKVSIRENARRLSTYVLNVLNFTKKTKVNIVGYSMGGLVMRHCIKYFACKGRVYHAVSVATPNHGAPFAGVTCPAQYAACNEMYPNSALLYALNNDNPTNNETHNGALKWETFTAMNDWTIVPWWSNSTPLNGAWNIQQQNVDHLNILNDWKFSENLNFVMKQG